MNVLGFILGVPLGAALLLAVVRSSKVAVCINAAAALATFIASLFLFFIPPETTTFFLIDSFNIYMIALTAFIALTTSLFSVRYVLHEVEIGRLQPKLTRFYHAMFHGLIFTLLLALSTNNLGVMWVAVEGATLTTVLMIGIYRTPAALEASWKYFILCGVGLALALFGTTFLYIAAQPVVGAGLAAITWSTLLQNIAGVNPALLDVAFIFLLVGYGTKVGLAPFHAWLPDAHAEGPTPISAVLSGLSLNVALYTVLRFKMLMAGNSGALAPGPLMIGLGLASLSLASFMLYRCRDIKRFFSYSSIEHMGIMTFAFGVGGPLANFAGLLHMAMHSLTKSAIFHAVGYISQIKGTQEISKIRGLTSSQPVLGWTLVIGTVAIAGMPPFGIFMSEFLVVASTFQHQPWLAIPLVLGLLVSFGALISKIQGIAFGPDDGGSRVGTISLAPTFIHLSLVLAAGLYLPSALVAWLQNIARVLG